MKSHLFAVVLTGVLLSGCGKITETMNALEYNRQEIDVSTEQILKNAQAIEEANNAIEENRRQLEKINEALKKANES